MALVPREGYWAEQANRVMDVLDEKLPIIGQVIGFFQGILNVDYETITPSFMIEFSGKWGTFSRPIIDFSYFMQYRELIFSFVRGIAWFFFLKRLLTRLPSVIYK